MRFGFRIPVALVTGVLLLAACSGDDGVVEQASDGERQERSLPVRAAETGSRDLSRIVRLSAPVEPMRTIRLAARTDGVVTDVRVEEGDRVEAGEVLASIDVREQRAELSRARARLAEKEANFQRMEQLRERDYVDAAQYETARAELEIARSDLELWQTRVDFGTVTSTIDGTVVERYIEPGEAISRHEPLFAIADLSSLVARLGVSELDVCGLRVGDSVVVQVDAVADGNPVGGVIRRIFPAADETSRLITVEVELPEALELGLRPGFLARARLLVDSRPDVLAVPSVAVGEERGQHFVMLINGDDRLERREIEAGVIRGAWREVIGGLEAGEKVVAANPLEMNAGELVRIVDRVE
ncbi:efflux RND transporter periplasmic adaptor subunit [Wenzhouxiangella sp. AB-CW3]|uniref:efflux RND transporter periplasmic adaptor subunit n=1 Tax=Wenzhouxiangella sp. AB-CW3 TaxID=2771012 RepID=UPI00168AB053|nr:efflux RND transporter periplasmic adaptor subunit [Wenzhouxiangella sp. AB-CW3]QOC21945.1 efflux RND transporter periplasmic adaptor subunit [Wenzhouxiangella sp. AB-CW3]